MRDAHDFVTAEIPGVEPPPPPRPPRTTIAERRLMCVYQDPKTVRNCRNCRHRVGDGPHARCSMHDFPVALGALCADHEE